MSSSTKKILIICSSMVILLVTWLSWAIKTQLEDSRSSLGQLKEILFPTKYSTNQMQNFQQDLKKAQNYAVHDDLGWDYAKVGNYEKAIEEYKKSIEIIEGDPGEHWNDVSKREMDRINEESRVSRQKFPRHRLVEVYEKSGRYPEALEQINWLLVHKPLDHVRAELLTKKQEILQKIAQTQSNP